jgi:hypothetical protein
VELLQHSVHTYKGVRDASFQAATLALKRYPCMTVSCLPFLLSGLANLPRPSADALLASLNGSVADGDCSDSCSDTTYTTLVGNVIMLSWSEKLAQAYDCLPGVGAAAAHLAAGKILALLQLRSRAGGRPLEVLGGTLHIDLSVVLASGERALEETLATLLSRQVDSSTASDFNASAAGNFWRDCLDMAQKMVFTTE